MAREMSDQTALFNRAYDETFDEIKTFVAKNCADPSYISDILQETYLEFFKGLLKKGEAYAENNRALLYKIAKRRVFRYYSLKQRLSRLVPLFVTTGDGEEFCAADEAQSGDSADEAISAAEAERVWGIINTYPAEIRKIMYLYFSLGMSHSEIARALGCSLSNVKNKLYRTLAEIREKENGDERK